MAIPLADQYSLALTQGDFRARVGAALMATAIVAFSATPLADATQQAQRELLASAVLQNVDTYLTQFAWIVVTRPGLGTVSDLTDTFIATTVEQVFDPAARQLIPAPA
jgi:hypothetical protein